MEDNEGRSLVGQIITSYNSSNPEIREKKKKVLKTEKKTEWWRVPEAFFHRSAVVSFDSRSFSRYFEKADIAVRRGVPRVHFPSLDNFIFLFYFGEFQNIKKCKYNQRKYSATQNEALGTAFQLFLAFLPNSAHGPNYSQFSAKFCLPSFFWSVSDQFPNQQ